MAPMVIGGNATVFVSNMDRAVEFYTRVLGLKLSSRFEDHWATVEAGGFTIGLHPASEKHPPPGTRGGFMIGLKTSLPIDHAAEHLRANGVKDVGEILRGDGGNFVRFHDADGTELYLWEDPNH